MSSASRCCSPLTTAAIVLVLPLAAVADSDGCDDQPVRLTAVWYDVTRYFSDGGEDAAEELRRRFCDIGVNTGWRRAAPGDTYGRRGRLEIPVVILRSHPLQSRASGPIMGEVPEVWTNPGPRPVRVYVDGIRDALGLDRPGGVGDVLVRVAVGRVATHEMVHALAPGEGHSARGLMGSSMGRNALVGSAPAMAAGHVSAVRAALHIGRTRSAPVVAETVRVAPLYGGDAPTPHHLTPR